MLDLKNISKTFNLSTVNEKVALENVNLHLDDGDFATIVGSNGAGKSTLFNAIAGEFIADTGTITLDGRVLFDSEKHINLTPQQRRVALTRILASEPQAILLDEPFSALDSYLKWELELGELLGAFDGPILWVSHELGGSGTPFRILRIIQDAGHAILLLQPEGAAEGSPVLRAECDAAGTYAAGQTLPVSFREEKLLFF